MQFCNGVGLAHSAFLGWDERDRGAALAFEMEKSLRCQMCGTAQWEWDRDRFAYEAVLEQCPGCYVRESSAEGMDHKAGVTVALSPTKTPEALERKRLAREMRERDRRDREDD